jgi:2',3'-cyclic-nucleotide 2'-phosphodiesterase (5'-nucleotidase family)
MLNRYISVLLLVFIFSGCSLFSAGSDQSTLQNQATSDKANTYPPPDPDIQAALNSYRDSLNQVMNVKVADVADTLRFGEPESALGNLAADALRFRAATELRTFVHVGVIDKDSFKLYLKPGILTLGDVYEFMPYQNHLVVLTLSGKMINKLSNEVARIGGAPLSGIRFRINGNGAQGVLANAEVVAPEKKYLVATSNYLADGGGEFSALWNPLDRIDLTNISIRDLYVDYFSNRRTIEPKIDGRIRR